MLRAANKANSDRAPGVHGKQAKSPASIPLEMLKDEFSDGKLAGIGTVPSDFTLGYPFGRLFAPGFREALFIFFERKMNFL